MIALMVGGPAHGEAWTVPDPPPWVLMVPREQDWSINAITSMEPSPPPYQYELRRLNPHRRSWAEWPLDVAYLCMAEPKQLRPPGTRDLKALYYAQTAQHLWLQAFEATTLPHCVAPGCTGKGQYKFTAAEPGRLAGRWWEHGDVIRLCPAHGDDVYNAQGVYGLDQLADWLKPDAMLDLLDAVGMSLFAEEITRSRGRAMRVTGSDPR